jgi:hypothetical protein
LKRRIPIDDLLVCIQTFEGTFDNANSGIKEFGTAVGTPQEGGFSQDPAASIYLSVIVYYILSKWSGRKDLNLRPPGPEPLCQKP